MNEFYEGDEVTHADDVKNTLFGVVKRVLPSGRVVVQWDGLTESEFECEPEALKLVTDPLEVGIQRLGDVCKRCDGKGECGPWGDSDRDVDDVQTCHVCNGDGIVPHPVPLPDVCDKDFDVIASGIAALVSEKNIAYGDSFNNATKILAILFPNGVPVEAYSRMLYIVRVLDKLGRISQDPYSLNEDAFRDIAGYSILAIANE